MLETYLPLPAGVASATFARAKISKQIGEMEQVPAPTSTERLSSVPDHSAVRESVEQSRQLKAWPAGLRIDDAPPATPAAAPPETEAASAGLAEGEYEVDGKMWVTMDRACELRGSNRAVCNMAAFNQEWQRVKNPHGPYKLYLKDDVMARMRKRAA